MRKPTNFQRLLREKTLHRYLLAVENVDLAAIEQIWQQATHDDLLEYMLLEAHEFYLEQETSALQDETSMDFKEGIHKSASKDQLPVSKAEPTLTSTPTPPRRKSAPWLATLAAILIVCVMVGGLLVAHTWQSGQAHLARRNPAPAAWCLASSAMTPPGYLSSISGLAENDVWAIESRGVMYDDGVTILHWDGTRWNVALQSDGKQFFIRIVETAPDNVWVVGLYSTGNSSSITLTMHWDGTHWQTVPSPNGSMNNRNMLVFLSAASANDIWATGNFSTSGVLVIHWNGQQWSKLANPTEEKNNDNVIQFSSIKAFAADDVWVAGDTIDSTNKIVIMHWDGAQWHTLANPPELAKISGGYQTKLDGTSDDDIWTVGNVGNGILIEHWNGKQWSVDTPLPLAPNNNDSLNGIVVTGSDNAWTVGQLGTSDPGFQPVIEHWNGHQWQVVSNPTLIGGLETVTMIGNQPWAVGFLGQTNNDPDKPLLEMPCK